MSAQRKSSIPGITSLPHELGRILGPVKENLELITGARPGSPVLTQLPATAQLSDCITAINLIIQRINQAGS